MKIECFSKRKLNVRKISIFTNLQPFDFNLQQDLKIVAFGKISKKFGQNLAKIQQILANFATFCRSLFKVGKKSANVNENLGLENSAKVCIV